MAAGHGCKHGLRNFYRRRPIDLPDFLVPAFYGPRSPASQPFSTSTPRASRVGATPVPVPPGVSIRLLEPLSRRGRITRFEPPKVLEVEGPLGKNFVQLPPFISFALESEGKKAKLKVLDPSDRSQKEMWGTTRSYLNNHVLGVSEGHTAILRLVGLGYRASLESTATTVKSEYEGQQFISLRLGYSHPVELPVPLGVKASTPLPTRILLEGTHKETILSFAAKIRDWRKPEPYKGKGIFVNDETIKLKAKKIK